MDSKLSLGRWLGLTWRQLSEPDGKKKQKTKACSSFQHSDTNHRNLKRDSYQSRHGLLVEILCTRRRWWLEKGSDWLSSSLKLILPAEVRFPPTTRPLENQRIWVKTEPQTSSLLRVLCFLSVSSWSTAWEKVKFMHEAFFLSSN